MKFAQYFTRGLPWFAMALALSTSAQASQTEPTLKPVARVIELDIGQSQSVILSDGNTAKVRLSGLRIIQDNITHAVRGAQVTVEVNDTPITLQCANYNLPVTVAGVLIDCTMVSAYNLNTDADWWGLKKDARFRLWPAGSTLIEPGTFTFPLKQKWFASGTQMANEPTFVDGHETTTRKRIYYHAHLDFGGCEGLDEVVAAADALVVSVAGKTLPGYEKTPVRERYDVIALLDGRGWLYRYSHLKEINPAVQLGSRVALGQTLGLLGKEGTSGGWSHLHFGIASKQPSGEWGTEEAYAYVWEAYLKEQKPKIIAHARPHHFVRTNEKVLLDGTKSWAASGKIIHYVWQNAEGDELKGARVERTYAQPGTYSEILKVTDAAGNVAYDFAAVQVIDPAKLDQQPPTIHASYWPTRGIKVNQPVTFKVRSFRTGRGGETLHFGDGTPPLAVRSDGNAVLHAPDGYATASHSFKRAGTFIVTAEHVNEHGAKATTHLAVEVSSD